MERQEVMENNTAAQLESLQALVSSLAFQTNTEPPHHQPRPQTPQSAPYSSWHPPRRSLASPRTADRRNRTLTLSSPSSRSSPNASYSSSSPTSAQTRLSRVLTCHLFKKLFKTLSDLDDHIISHYNARFVTRLFVLGQTSAITYINTIVMLPPIRGLPLTTILSQQLFSIQMTSVLLDLQHQKI